jgi:catechol 2,3-dioxygenase-like lactoylglutathione lyase family enzyme
MTAFKPLRLAVVSLRASDMQAMIRFYRDVVGLALLPHHGHRPAFDLGHGAYLVIVQEQPGPHRETAPARFPDIAFAVADLDEAVEHLQEQGVELPWGIQAGLGARWVEFHDPAGYLIEFAQFE